MEATELRIGNLVQLCDISWEHFRDESFCSTREFKVKGFNGAEIVHFEITTTIQGMKCISGERVENIIPIRLTEEWLIMFGAEKYEFDNGQHNQYRIGNRLFVVRDNFIVDYGSSVIIKYVHRLQNLYFALTGEELKLKNNLHNT